MYARWTVYEEHEWDEGTITTPATYEAEGVITYVCKYCEEIRTEVIPKLPPLIEVNGVKLSFETIDGTAILRPTQAQMSAILSTQSKIVIFNLRGQSTVVLYAGAGWFKDVDKTLTIVTDKGEASVTTKTLWNNSGKTRVITVENGKLDLKNI